MGVGGWLVGWLAGGYMGLIGCLTSFISCLFGWLVDGWVRGLLEVAWSVDYVLAGIGG